MRARRAGVFMPPRLGQMHLHNTDAALVKAGLAVGEVHAPQPPEALVIAELFQTRGCALKVARASDAASLRSGA